MKNNNRKKSLWIMMLLMITMLATDIGAKFSSEQMETVVASENVLDQLDIESYSGKPFALINDNVPNFSEADMQTKSYEKYSSLDSKGRCGVASANIGEDLMPREKRGTIGKVKPSGWRTVKYDCVDGKYLYNRCHLIGFQLTAENANKKNLITGTRYLNVEGMLPFENMVADYIHETGNHVLYRVTPVFEEDNLVASGVQMEAKSVEDDGEGILFNVYCYNVQPGIEIDYKTGKSTYVGGENIKEAKNEKESGKTSIKKSDKKGTKRAEAVYVLNTNTKKFHTEKCSSLKQMKEGNKGTFNGSREELIQDGYDPCKRCRP